MPNWVQDAPHGTYAGYKDWHCHCGACLDARRAVEGPEPPFRPQKPPFPGGGTGLKPPPAILYGADVVSQTGAWDQPTHAEIVQLPKRATPQTPRAQAAG